ncbi:hypothetical protein ACOSQ3_006578 [Xanthoceras sorbifolium]
MNVECLLPAALPNNGGQPQVVRKHVNIGNEGELDSRMPQAAVPMSNAAGGLHGGRTAPRLQVPPLGVDGATLRSPGDRRYNSRVERRNVERGTDPHPTTDRKNDRVRDNRRRPID